ncbi:PfkB family carbohydrate kinase [Klenkia brasiliensis]|uniref:PfkB family carbohydrate kinase n=1 Tax=Klenkia brasiliensis TaxID=333142 RepID=UPI000B833102|nr:PfkB family carbohydrate kinase [Klenkia brasiliensis]
MRTLVVVGDTLLDVDTDGRAEKLSPDGPVPVVRAAAERTRAGGAGLVAALAAADGAGRVVLVTPLAEDADGATLRSVLPAGVELVAVPWAGSTAVKHRIRAGGQTVARVDRGGDPGPVGPLPDAVATVLAGADAVVVADYGLGATADPELRGLLTALARRRPVVWDPHPRGAPPVPGCRLVTPNAVEATGADPGPRPDVGAVADRALALRAQWAAGTVAVTLGAAGALATVGEDGVLAVPAPTVDVGDTCGAGDAFAAAAGWALAGGALPPEAVAAAVRAASAHVAAPAPTPTGAGVLVATGGCFDLLHAGHVATLEAARALGDRLVVCVNSDASVARLKGPGRPLQPQADRVRILRALACVDDVVVFDEDTPEQVLRGLRPQLWVKGGDYSGVAVPEAAVLAGWGGRVVTVPFLAGRSTTALAELARA